MRFDTHAVLAAAAGGVVSFAMTGSALAFQTRPSSGPASTAPASTMPADATPLVATITSVKGGVEVRAGEGQPWQKAQVGMKIDQGTEIRTGLRSAVQFVVGGDQTITLDRLGTVTVLQAFESRGKAKTDLGLKYGRARYDIKKTDLEHESTIRSPGSTLAIRGTDVIYEDQAPWVPRAISREGRAEFRNYRRQFLAFGGTKRAAVAADKNSTAEQAVSTTKNDPKGAFAGRTEAEDELNLSLQGIGGADAPGLQALQNIGLRGGLDDSFTGTPPVPGPLEFSLTWFDASGGGVGGAATNLDLFVTDPGGNVVSALNPNVGSGSAVGQHGGDDVGASGLGSETVLWNQFFPPGTYTVRVVHQGGADAQVSSFTATQSENVVIIKDFAPTGLVLTAGGQPFTDTVATQANPTPQADVANQRVQRAADRRAARAAKNAAAAARGASRSRSR